MRALKKRGQDQAIGRSRGGLSTKIHATCDALGNPTGFFLTPGQAHDLQGADALLPKLEADQRLADKAYDADTRVLKLLKDKGIEAVIPPKANRLTPRSYDTERYKDRHLIEAFFLNSSISAPSLPVMTRPPATSSQLFSLPPLPSCSLN